MSQRINTSDRQSSIYGSIYSSNEDTTGKSNPVSSTTAESSECNRIPSQSKKSVEFFDPELLKQSQKRNEEQMQEETRRKVGTAGTASSNGSEYQPRSGSSHRPPLPPKRSPPQHAEIVNEHSGHRRQQQQLRTEVSNPRKGKFLSIAKLIESMLLRGFYFDHVRMEKAIRSAWLHAHVEVADFLFKSGDYHQVLKASMAQVGGQVSPVAATAALVSAINRIVDSRTISQRGGSDPGSFGAMAVIKTLKQPQNEEAQVAANDVPFYLMPFLAPPIASTKGPSGSDDKYAKSCSDGCTSSVSAATTPAQTPSSYPEILGSSITQINLNMLLPQARSPVTQESDSPQSEIEDCYTPSVLRIIIPSAYLPLYTRDVPTVPLSQYIEQLLTLLHCNIECYLMALCCLSRVAQKIPVCRRSVHRMLLCAIVVCAKSRADRYYPMEHYAKGGGVSVSDLLSMETAFLTVIDWHVGVSTDTYVDAIYSMRHHCAIAAHVVKDGWAQTAWGELLTILPVPTPALLESELKAARQEEEREFAVYVRKLFFP
eukprot:GILI01015178.1.p1 GENE.GILI01015178.1~~GILI01015178.1.p1  ORF type:complete len:542 (+),score=29.57 GILI01015178.1:247-1872(+)